LWQWLADQPAYIEVATGMAFVLIVAPVVLGAVAVLTAQLETVVEGIAVRLPLAGFAKADRLHEADQHPQSRNVSRAAMRTAADRQHQPETARVVRVTMALRIHTAICRSVSADCSACRAQSSRRNSISRQGVLSRRHIAHLE
jgi:hypothetical protein